MTDPHAECRRRDRNVVRSVGDEKSPEEYWARVRETAPPYFWNSIQTGERSMSDDEINQLVRSDDVQQIRDAIRNGGRVPTPARKCVWCDQPRVHAERRVVRASWMTSE